MENDTKRPLIQSVSRAIAILQCFTTEKELGLTEISRKVGLHKSTTAGIVHTLKEERFLEVNEETGKLKLGSALFLLTAMNRHELEDISEPYLSLLLEHTRETVNLAILDGNEVVYIAKKESPHSMRISTCVGKRMPLYCTAIGKAIMANMDTKNVEKLISKIDFITYTDKTISGRQQLLDAFPLIRNEGVAYDSEEFEYGLTCIAAPIYQRSNEPIGAVSVSGPTVRMGNETSKRIADELKEAAQKISKGLSY